MEGKGWKEGYVPACVGAGHVFDIVMITEILFCLDFFLAREGDCFSGAGMMCMWNVGYGTVWYVVNWASACRNSGFSRWWRLFLWCGCWRGEVEALGGI